MEKINTFLYYCVALGSVIAGKVLEFATKYSDLIEMYSGLLLGALK